MTTSPARQTTESPSQARTLRLSVGASGAAAESVDFLREAERLGVHSAWCNEMWGYDALTQLGYLAAKTSVIGLGTSIVQLGARTPAMLAMSAMSLQHLTGGRFTLGIGVSGPQVMEGWHGVRFHRPVQATRETIEIIRMISRGDRLDYHGQMYDLPLPDSQGRALRPMVPPVRVPVYIASLGPANLRLTGELADGWIASTFMPETAEVFPTHLRAGARAAGRTLADLDLHVPVTVEVTDDVDEAVARRAAGYAFTIGAMGSATSNFYSDALARQGYAEQVAEVARLWRDGRRDDAARLVPREIGARTSLIGTPAMIADRIRLHRSVGVSTLHLSLSGSPQARLDTLAQITDLVAEINREQPG
jgi:F420-dependent oxidoreductase-like protein